MAYIDKDTDIKYLYEDLKQGWENLPDDVKQDYADNGISSFEEWLECATDFSGHIAIE